MKFPSALLTACVALCAGVGAVSEGPFALYTKSSDPNFDSRVINIGQRDGMFTITTHISDPSQITSFNVNFFLDDSFQPGYPSGYLVWGAVPPFGKMYTGLALTDPSSTIAPFLLDFAQPSFFSIATQYTTTFNFTADGKLQFENISNRFYAATLHLPRFNADAVVWQFGQGPAPAGYSPVALHKYTPP